MNASLQVLALKTRIFKLNDPIVPFIIDAIEGTRNGPALLENAVLAITSKIVSLAEGQTVARNTVAKEELVRRESDHFLGSIGYGTFLTIKHGLLIPSAGIDESNSASNDYILYPKNPFQSARQIREALAQRFKLRHFGVLLTDSHTTPLRAGVTGIALAHSGFRAVTNKVGTPDLFGRSLKMTQINVADALAVSAVYCMGEANECSPLAILSGGIDFISPSEEIPGECQIQKEKDLYWPLLRAHLGETQD